MRLLGNILPPYMQQTFYFPRGSQVLSGHISQKYFPFTLAQLSIMRHFIKNVFCRSLYIFIQPVFQRIILSSIHTNCVEILLKRNRFNRIVSPERDMRI